MRKITANKNIGHIGDGFYGSNDPTNSVKALKAHTKLNPGSVASYDLRPGNGVAPLATPMVDCHDFPPDSHLHSQQHTAPPRDGTKLHCLVTRGTQV